MEISKYVEFSIDQTYFPKGCFSMDKWVFRKFKLGKFDEAIMSKQKEMVRT